jgi:hypothetical protein
VIAGDSLLNINLMRSGKYCALADDGIFGSISTLLADMLDVNIEFRWLARRFTREPEELCNALLENRLPNFGIHSLENQAVAGDLEISLDKAIEHVSTNRRRAIRSIPTSLRKHFAFALQHIMCKTLLSCATRRKVFLIFPHLLGAFIDRLASKKDFEAIKSHLIALQSVQYLINTVEAILMPQHPPFVGTQDEKSVAKRIKKLAAAAFGTKLFQGMKMALR